MGKDGNNRIYPFAFGMEGKEETVIWIPFLRVLHRCIDDLPNLTIISNRHHAITRSMREVFLNAYHGWCNHHIKRNMRSGYKQTKHINGLFSKAMKAYQIPDFDEAMLMINDENSLVGIYL